MRLVRTTTAGLLTAVVLLTGCGADGGSSSNSGDESGARADAPGSGEFSTGGGAGAAKPGSAVIDPTGAKPVVGVPVSQAQADRQVTYTATVRAQTGDIAGNADKVADLARERGGYVVSSSVTAGDDARAEIVVKVPPRAFEAYVDAVAKLGKEAVREVSSEDLTEQFADTEGRLAAAKTSAQRIRGFLARANSVTELATLEAELARREGEIESLTKRLATLRGKVAMSTVTVVLTRTPPERVAQVSDDIPGFWTGLKTGLAAFGNFVLVALTALGVLLPFLVTGAIVLAAARALRRRRTRLETPADLPAA